MDSKLVKNILFCRRELQIIANASQVGTRNLFVMSDNEVILMGLSFSSHMRRFRSHFDWGDGIETSVFSDNVFVYYSHNYT